METVVLLYDVSIGQQRVGSDEEAAAKTAGVSTRTTAGSARPIMSLPALGRWGRRRGWLSVRPFEAGAAITFERRWSGPPPAPGPEYVQARMMPSRVSVRRGRRDARGVAESRRWKSGG
jgi:hypothetical protein